MENRRFKAFFKNQRKFSRALKQLFDEHFSGVMHKHPFAARVLFSWERALASLYPLGGTSGGNEAKLYNNGDDAFFAMKDAIRNAEKNIWLETYIFEPDILGTRIRNALIDASLRGVEVIMLYDHFGSPRINHHFLSPLLAAGGQAHAFNPIWPWRKRGPLLVRDHRKMLIVDNEIGFCGGANISTDYAGPKLGNSRFRDTVIQINGPAVSDLARLFLSSLQETTGFKYSLNKRQKPVKQGVYVQVLGSNQRRNLYAIQQSMEVTLKGASHYCYFTTPYFLPYEPLRKAMIKAAKRGVDIRILTAGLSDVPLMRLASQRVYGQFLESGIRIYEMFEKTLHAKTAAIDGVYGTVGSYNLDHWSARRNLEVNVSAFDTTVAKDLKNQFYEDLKFCREVTMENWRSRSWFQRLKQWAAYQLMRL